MPSFFVKHNEYCLLYCTKSYSYEKITIFSSTCKELHTPDISDKSFSYSDEIAGNDMLAALSEVISEKIWDELSEVGVIIDESTDITTTKLNQVKIT
nr:6837_t:CDS:2 [Entrophospora candida]